TSIPDAEWVPVRRAKGIGPHPCIAGWRGSKLESDLYRRPPGGNRGRSGAQLLRQFGGALGEGYLRRGFRWLQREVLVIERGPAAYRGAAPDGAFHAHGYEHTEV